MGKKRKAQSYKPWCWYCDREFDDEKVLIVHQRAKHFKCMYCHKRLNSASGLVIHVAQIHKETITIVPNSVEGHDTPELEIFGMEGVPQEDLQRHRASQPILSYKRIRVSEGGLLPLLAAQKASVPNGPDVSNYTTRPNPATTTATAAVAVANVLPKSPPIGIVLPVTSPVVAAASAIISAPFYAPYVVDSNDGSASMPALGLGGHISPSSSASFVAQQTSVDGLSASMGTASLPVAFSPLQSSLFNNVILPPSIDANGRLILGAIIIAPDLAISMEEKRASLERYRFKEG